MVVTVISRQEGRVVSTEFESKRHFDATKDHKHVWRSYSDVYELMGSIPFVKKLRELHVAAMKNCNVILDAGCGPGLITRDLAMSEDKKVIAIDLNEDMLKQATHRLKNFKNIELHCGNVLDLPFDDNTFDGYVSNNVLHFVDDPHMFFSEMIRVLKPGGIISLASARLCCDMEILIDAAYDYFVSRNADEETMRQVEQMAAANKSLLKSVKSVYEPHEVSKILCEDYGCQAILHEGLSYLEQSFHVVVKK